MNTNEIYEVAQIREMLSQAGLQTTAVRLAVMRLLLQTNSPISCAQITKTIVPFGFQRSAFPKVLGRLVEVGLIQQLKHGTAATQFRWTDPALNHFDFERNDFAITDVA